MALFPVLRVFRRSNMVSTVEKYLLKTPGNGLSQTLTYRMSLDALALKNLCLWCEFQSRLLFIISLLLKTFLTALQTEFHEAYCEIRISSPMYIVVAFDKFKYIVEGNIYLFTFGLFMMAWASILFLHC